MKKLKLISDFKPREYQQSIFANALYKNTLVVLPTGLGKTVIAIMKTVFEFNKENKKFLFLAPTKPLLEQQKISFEGFFENSEEFIFEVLTGLVSPKKRKEKYKQGDFFFSTPQLIQNDLLNGIIDFKDFSLIVIDEAHRATGNYAYCFVAEQATSHNISILSLTASPGTSKDQIREVMENLRVEHLEMKRYEDSDVKPYVNETKIDHIQVELPEKFLEIKLLLDEVFGEFLEALQKEDCLKGKNKNSTTKKDLLDLQMELRAQIASGEVDEQTWRSISLAAGLMKLQYGIELFESQELSAAHSYFYNFFREGGDSSKAAQELSINYSFRKAFDEIAKLKSQEVLHPKLYKLRDLVISEVQKNAELKIIVFNQYRESAQKIVEELNNIKGIDSQIFVGQAKKGDVKMSQKEQKQILQDFREAKFNVLVSTSVGEEGLDIPKVDLVIFYEPIASAIRSIQRIGRTGRFKKGHAYILQTKGTRDMITKHIANAKEKRMYKALAELKEEFEGKLEEENNGLNRFLKKPDSESRSQNTDSEKQTPTHKLDFEKILIYIDGRENQDLQRALFKKESLKIESRQLEVGDIVLNEHLAIERKAKIDFVNSLLDKRLFPQLLDLAKNFKRPVLLLEGSENIYTLRNVNANVIRSALSAIAIDLRIPIIQTDSIEESAEMIETMAKRTVKKKKAISLVSEKGGLDESQEIEKVVSSIPKINVASAKLILEKFPSIKSMVEANIEDFQKIEGIGKVRAEYIYNFLRREY